MRQNQSKVVRWLRVLGGLVFASPAVYQGTQYTILRARAAESPAVRAAGLINASWWWWLGLWIIAYFFTGWFLVGLI
ncbi:MAG: hypothetical protein WA861_19110, partial [Candidatus Binatus sp.]